MAHVFDSDYFNGGKKVGGYAHEGYWDYPIHWATYRKVKEYRPTSVLELGAARGYVLRRLEDDGVRVRGLEISEHCYLTRAIEDIVTWDITQTPWPVKDQEFDLCLSIAVLEHIPEDKLGAVFAEMKRTCKRGLHGIDLVDHDHFDKTHCSIHPLPWWEARLPEGQVGIDKEDLEKGPANPPGGTGVKLNVGSFTTMFHNGWRNLDRIDLRPWAQQHGYSFTHWDVLNGLPYDEGVVDLIFCCHMLEHLTYDEGGKFLAECRRVLKPGGVARFLTPDAGKLIRHYGCAMAEQQRRNNSGIVSMLDDFNELSPTAASRPTPAGKLYELLMAEHKAIYDYETIDHVLKGAGFDKIERAKFRHSRNPLMQRETTDLYPELSLIVEVVK